MAKDLVPVALGVQHSLNAVQGGSVMGRDPTPYHDGTPTMSSHLLNAVIVVALPPSPPHAHSAVIVLQAEPGLISEEDHSPLLTSPADVTPGPGCASSLVDESQLRALGWMTGVVLGSMQAVANSLCADVGVGGSEQLPPDSVCSGSSHCLGLSCDETIFSCCGLLGSSWARPVFNSSSGLETLFQSCDDGGRHPKPSGYLPYANAVLEPPQGSSSVQQA